MSVMDRLFGERAPRCLVCGYDVSAQLEQPDPTPELVCPECGGREGHAFRRPCPGLWKSVVWVVGPSTVGVSVLTACVVWLASNSWLLIVILLAATLTMAWSVLAPMLMDSVFLMPHPRDRWVAAVSVVAAAAPFVVIGVALAALALR